MVSPVIYPASSDAKNAATPLISCGSPNLQKNLHFYLFFTLKLILYLPIGIVDKAASLALSDSYNCNKNKDIKVSNCNFFYY